MGVVCLSMSIMYSVWEKSGDWQGFLVRTLTSLFLLIYSIITINLTSVINAFSLFVAIGTAISLFYESLQTSAVQNENARNIIGGVSNALIYLAFALSIMSLAEFNILSLVGGVLLGLGLGLLVLIIKKHKKLSIILPTILIYIALGIAVGFGINSIIATKHFISAITTLASIALLLIEELLMQFVKESKTKTVVCIELKTITMILFIISIYLYS